MVGRQRRGVLLHEADAVYCQPLFQLGVDAVRIIRAERAETAVVPADSRSAGGKVGQYVAALAVMEGAVFFGRFYEILYILHPSPGRYIERKGQAGDDVFAVLVVVDEKIAAYVGAGLAFFLDERVAETVNGLDDDVEAFFVCRRKNSMFQFFAGPVRKGQAENLSSFGSSRLDDSGDAAGQHVGFSRAGRRV